MSSSTKKTIFTEDIRARSTAIVVCLALMLGFASTGYGDAIIGDWESTMDGWEVGDVNFAATPGMTPGATLHSHSLGVSVVTDTAGGWKMIIDRIWSNGQVTPFQYATTVSVDVTMIASEWTISPDHNDGIKPLDNIVVMGPTSWWEQISPVTYPDFNSDANRAGYWKPEDGDKTVTYTFNLAARGTDTFAKLYFISNRVGSFDRSGYIYLDNARIITAPGLTVNKCTVAAGKTQYMEDDDYNDMKDSFTASGTVVFPEDINDVNTVEVKLVSLTDDYIAYDETLTDFNSAVVNSKGKYTHTAKLTKGQAGKITSLTLNLRKGTFAVTAKNIDLTGLACPLELKITLGSDELKGQATEAVVNGTKTIPTRLMRAYKDTLIVPPGKTKVKSSTKASSDSLSVTGEIAVQDINTTDPNLYGIPVVITWIDSNDLNNVQTFTIPIHSFKIPKTGRLYKCSKIEPNVAPVAEPNARVAASIDLDKCTFAVSITKADLNAVSGQTKFGIRFGDFNEVNDVNLAWKK